MSKDATIPEEVKEKIEAAKSKKEKTQPLTQEEVKSFEAAIAALEEAKSNLDYIAGRSLNKWMVWWTAGKVDNLQKQIDAMKDILAKMANPVTK